MSGGPQRKARLVVELTEGAIRVTFGKRSLTIYAGSDLPEAQVPADFVIRLDDILTWDPPNDTSEVLIEDLQKIVAAIEVECDKRGLVVIFE